MKNGAIVKFSYFLFKKIKPLSCKIVSCCRKLFLKSTFFYYLCEDHISFFSFWGIWVYILHIFFITNDKKGSNTFKQKCYAFLIAKHEPIVIFYSFFQKLPQSKNKVLCFTRVLLPNENVCIYESPTVFSGLILLP